MFWKKKYIEFPLNIERRKDGTSQYFITVTSGDRRLVMLVDSGATTCQIMESSIEKCHYELASEKTKVMMIDGSFKETQLSALSLGVVDHKSNKKYYCTLPFLIMPTNSFHALDGTGADGIVGSSFLQYCSIDFVYGVVRLYLEL